MKKDIRYVPTPHPIVEAMLDLANFGPDDLLYDLGSGDGRLVLAAARRGGRGVGIEIDGSLVTRSQDLAKQSALDDRVDFRQQSFFDADLSQATVVTVYLFHSVNTKLLPKILAETAPGTRLISHSFAMEGWAAERRVTVDNKWLYLWTVPSAGRLPAIQADDPRSDREHDW